MKLYQPVIIFILMALMSLTVQAQEFPGQYVDLPGVKLWVIDSGGNGEPVILLHPRTGNADFFQASLPALANAGYRAIAIDFPGWGRSMVNDPDNKIPVAVTLEALFDELGFESVHLVGTAMGGYIALDYATYKPERLKTLTIAASGLGLQGDP
ncbi:MAG: alpha/beta hydrolase, partial [Gammaproteobacteria bacterium]|nr:alpha/beta hydrolase [Gammaproteobacteria bacterium]